MSRDLQVLAAQKEVLLARAALERLSVAMQVESLRERSRVPPRLASLLGDRQVRPLLMALAMFALRRSRFRKIALIAGIVATVVKVLRK